MQYHTNFPHQLNPGHSACAGCGLAIAARHVADAAGKNVIMATATGCLEVFSTPYPQSSWKMPWIHSLFENSAAVASGILAALKKHGLASVNASVSLRGDFDGTKNNVIARERSDRSNDKVSSSHLGIASPSARNDNAEIKIIAQGGDGATFDIGFGLISGMWERGENILYVCYDNEAYMNTGVQASGATPYGAATTTAPSGEMSEGNELHKKDMVAIALAHGLKYVATSTCAYTLDIEQKVKRALAASGPSYLQILTVCVPGWKVDSDKTIELGKLAQQSGLYPVVEFINGKLAKVMNYPAARPSVEKYLKIQGRYKHLFKDEAGKKVIKKIQEIADGNVEKYRNSPSEMKQAISLGKEIKK
ncbi:MAG: thiamine pyrophosphate-dependent enzyme [bacterium]